MDFLGVLLNYVPHDILIMPKIILYNTKSHKNPSVEKMSEEQIVASLRTAGVDDVIYCVYCDYPNLEPEKEICL